MTAPPTSSPRRQRLARVLASAGLRPDAEPQPVLSHSNDTWLLDDPVRGGVVLRVCWQGDPARLLREAALGRVLPAAVGYPEVLAAGEVRRPGGTGQPLTWAVTRRLPGRPLAEVWPELDRAGRSAASASVTERLRALHTYRPEPGLAPQLRPTPLSPAPTAAEVIGRAMSPWPDGIAVLLAAAEDRLPGPLLRRVAAVLDADAALAPAMDERAAALVHGDLHLHNVWTDGRRVTGLLDLEFVRPAEPWVELVRLVDQVDEDALGAERGHAELLAGLRRWYPELFAVDRLAERLRLLQVAYQLRELVLWPRLALGVPAPVDHPSRRLAALVEGTDQLSSAP